MVMPMTEPWADEAILGDGFLCSDCRHYVDPAPLSERDSDVCRDCAAYWRRCRRRAEQRLRGGNHER